MIVFEKPTVSKIPQLFLADLTPQREGRISLDLEEKEAMISSYWFDLLLAAMVIGGGYIGERAEKVGKTRLVLLYVPILSLLATALYFLFDLFPGRYFFLALAFLSAIAFCAFWPSEWFEKKD